MKPGISCDFMASVLQKVIVYFALNMLSCPIKPGNIACVGFLFGIHLQNILARIIY